MTSHKTIPALIVSAALATFAMSTHAQDKIPATQSTAPTLKVYSRETIVDVTVTDAQGNPVHGLTQSDFIIKEDNKPQPIRSFEEYGSATPTATQTPRKLPPNVYTNLQPPPSSSALNILLLDGLNTAPPDATQPGQVSQSFTIQTRVKQAAAKYLQKMSPGTRVALLGLSRSLRILQEFSSDANLLSAAVDTMETNMDGIASTPAMWCMQQDMRNRMTLETLNQIAASVTSIKGKKNLIWFTAGFPTITDPSVTNQPVCEAGHRGLPDYAAGLRKTYSLLAAAQVAVFPVGAAGVGKYPNPVGSGFVDYGTPEMAEIELSFESMAETTGGTAFYNSNDLASLVSQAVEKGANYYTLTYSPPGQKYNNAHHTIKVFGDRPDLHLVYRQTYDAVDPATIKPLPGLTLATAPPETTGPIDMRAAMSRNLPTSTDLLFDVQVEPSTEPAKPSDPPIFGMLDPKLHAKPLTRYGFEYALPARQTAFADAADGTRHAALEFDLAAYDGDGKLVTSLSQATSCSSFSRMKASTTRVPAAPTSAYRLSRNVAATSLLCWRKNRHAPIQNALG